jgi:hypothetical protein
MTNHATHGKLTKKNRAEQSAGPVKGRSEKNKSKYSVGKGKLWMNGTNKVSVPFTANTENGPVKFKIIVSPGDDANEIRQQVLTMTKEVVEVDNDLCALVLEAAQVARQDPKQQKLLQEAIERTKRGAEKSREALSQRILMKKKEALKRFMIDLMGQGVTLNQLQQLARDAIVECVMSK